MVSGSIQDVKKKYVQSLMAIEGVRSIGIGKNPQGEMVIMIGLDKPRSAIPAELPTELDGYPVIIQTVGDIKAQ
ncbi:MAG: hypothetical protein GXP08_05730 [Gammaproteobacteria bacterium]|nr:hypothetical protein [Gammaproteobacteria bacterium]